MIDPQKTVADLVLDHTECAPVFQRHRIDFCCKGGMSIAEACARAGADPAVVLDELSGAIAARRGQPGLDPRALSTPALIAHIIGKHHTYLRVALPFLQPLAAKVSRVHGERDPRLRALHAAVVELADELGPHLDAEEQSLFPLLAAGLDGPRAARELATMKEEHLRVGELLARIRQAADDYRVPDWACNSYRTLFAELAQLEADVLVHVHLENHALAPRFAEPEA